MASKLIISVVVSPIVGYSLANKVKYLFLLSIIILLQNFHVYQLIVP